MTQPSRQMPIGRRLGSAPQATGQTPAALTMASTNRIVQPTIRLPRERVLLCGDSFCGKSYAYMRLAAASPDKAFYVIDTNDTMPKFLAPGGEFESLAFTVGGNVYPYPCFEWPDVMNAWASIKQRVKPGDYVVCDLVSQTYNFAQQHVGNARGLVLTDAAYQRAMNNKGFGAFEAGDWQLVKLIHESFINGMLNDARLNAILVAHVNEIIDVEGRNKRESLLLFDQVGLKPQGPDVVYKQPDTIIMLWAQRYIDRDARGRRTGTPRTIRYMGVLKDRGIPLYEKRVYDRDCFDTLKEIRDDLLGDIEAQRNAVTEDEINEVLANPGAIAERTNDDTDDEDVLASDEE